jgi:serine/threonine-protein kinase
VPGERPAPQRALNEYYSLISSGQYSGAWNQLSPSFRNNSRVHPQGYDSYSNWWGQVDRVEVLDSRVVEAGADVARVDTRLRYVMRSGRTSVESVRFKLVWDAAANRWLIDDTKLI